MPKKKKLPLNSGIKTYQILTNDNEVCIPRLSSILLAVHIKEFVCLRLTQSPAQTQRFHLLLCNMYFKETNTLVHNLIAHF